MHAFRKQHLYLVPFILIAVTVAIYSFPLLISFGQELIAKQGLELTPPSQEVSAKPGQKVKFAVKIRNPFSNSVPVKIRVEDFTASGDEGQIALTKDDDYSVIGWAQVEPSSFTLKAGGEQTVSVSLSVPQSAAGGRYGALVFSVAPNIENQKGSVTAVSQEIASLFLLKIDGPANENLTLESIKAPSFSEFGPIPMSMTFRNTGNIHTKTAGLINVTDMFGNKVQDVVVKPTNVFPGATRVITTNLNKRFLFGFYTITAAMYYGKENHVLNASSRFFVMPIRLIGIVVIVLAIIYAGRKRIRKAGKALFG
ncbi:MAG: hypothetical protein UZ21_OP11001000941 [Microgenomates bacterium OLB22]|nr:MAG: hypothetical protein UZ21_OP11001000941 [Microgenomates bacterium OLB22]